MYKKSKTNLTIQTIKKLILMKKFTLLFAVACMFMATTFAQTSGTCGTNLTWTLTGSGTNLTLTITGTGAMTDYVSYSSVPWYSQQTLIKTAVIENNVTSIGNYAFFSCRNLTSVTIPSSVTTIGNYAFDGCSSLTSVTIPNLVTSIGEHAFHSCNSLISVTIPNLVTSIRNFAFYGCSSLTSVTIPNSVTSIGSSAFDRCSSLASVTIPNLVTSIGDYAFFSCSSLTSVTIPNSVTTIGEHAFHSCSSLISVTIPNLVISIRNFAFSGCSSLTSVTIGNSVTTIESSAFSGCSGLVSVTIPSSVTSIGSYAFSDCSSLTSVTIPSSVTTIGNYAFDGCSGLTSINVDENNLNYSSIDGILYTELQDTLILCPAGKIGTVTIPNSVMAIGSSAFYYCSGITAVTIGNSVTSIGSGAFEHCSSLTSITIPNSVTSIGNYAFYGCSSLISITCNAVNPPAISSNTFNSVPVNIPVYIPCGTTEAYQNSAWGNNLFTNFVIEGTTYYSFNENICAGATYSDENFTALDSTGTYYAYLTNNNGCDSIITLNLTVSNSSDYVPTDLTVINFDNGHKILWTATVGSSYDIYRNNEHIATVSTTSYQDNDLVAGNTYCYKVKVNGCYPNFTPQQCVTATQTGINEVLENNISIFPNPVKDELHINLLSFQNLTGLNVEIVDLSGRTVWAYAIRPDETAQNKGVSITPLQNGTQSINVSHLLSGIYFVKIQTDKGIVTQKFIKE
jgi:hypothetical protein